MGNLQSRLKEYRLTHKLTQTQIADLLGMTYQEYQKIENGKTIIRADKLQHICETLDISADWLLGLDQEQDKARPVFSVPAAIKEWENLDDATREEYQKAISEFLSKKIGTLKDTKKQSNENIG